MADNQPDLQKPLRQPPDWLLRALEAHRLDYSSASRRMCDAYSFLCTRGKFLHHGRVVTWTSHNLSQASPPGWLEAVAALPHSVLMDFYDGGASARAALPHLPADLADFLRCAWDLQLPRRAMAMPEAEVQATVPVKLRKTKGASPKKLHETGRMATLLRGLALATGANGVVDVGAGSGYVGQALTRGDCGIPTVGIEGSDSVHAGAEVREQINQVGRRAVKHAKALQQPSGSPAMQDQIHQPQAKPLGDSRLPVAAASPAWRQQVTLPTLDLAKLQLQTRSESQPTHDRQQDKDHLQEVTHSQVPHLLIHGMLVYQDTDGAMEVMQRALQALQLATASGAEWRGAVLTGLHACGNLTPCVLEAFFTASSFTALACVGCCFNGLSLVQGITNDWFEALEGGGPEAVLAPRRRGADEVVLARLVRQKEPPSQLEAPIEMASSTATTDPFHPPTPHEQQQQQQQQPLSPTLPSENSRVFHAMPMSQSLEQAMQQLPQGFAQIDPYSMRRAASGRPIPSQQDYDAGVIACMYRIVLNEVLRRPGAPYVDHVRTRISPQQYGQGVGDYLRAAFGTPNGPSQRASNNKMACLREGENPEGSSASWRIFSPRPEGQAVIAGLDWSWAPPPLVPVMEEIAATYTERVKGLSLLKAYMVLQNMSEALLEDVLVLDRCCYLMERLRDEAAARGSPAGGSVYLLPIFDPELSPRNQAIVAVRGGPIQ